MSTVIKVENLSKQYRLGTIGTGTLSHDLKRWWYNVRGKEDPYLKIGQVNDRTQKGSIDDYVWALKDINFEVKQGDVVGIIGRNGAGKSTLLKILSRTTLPTTGSVKVKGRIASLLEVGTGFHPELTGRENIFLNGAILGMRKAEIKSKFDAIVDFAGVEKYIDTPVKRYSSGMYVRLAFAVAAHLEPEILIVDEVLAVGDLEFQKKAVDKMFEVSESGSTVLFVSHNMAAVRSLCKTGIFLSNGSISAIGNVESIISDYVLNNNGELQSGENLLDIERKETAGELVFESINFLNDPIDSGEPIAFDIKLKKRIDQKSFNELDFGIAINDAYNHCLIHLSNRFKFQQLVHEDDNTIYRFRCENILKPGEYNVTLFLRTEDKIQDWLKNIVRFSVSDGNPYGYHNSSHIHGTMMPDFQIEQYT